MNIVVMETKGRIGACEHAQHIPRFAGTAAQFVGLTPTQVRAQFPPFRGTCTTCNHTTTIYASKEHYDAGEFALVQGVIVPPDADPFCLRTLPHGPAVPLGAYP